MSISAFSYLLGVVELLVGIPMLLFPHRTGEWFVQFMKNESRLRVAGAVFVVVAVLTLTEGVAIGTNTAGLMRLVAWVTALKSLVTCWFPAWQARRAERILSRPAMRHVMGVLAVGFGVLFLLAGNALQ